MDFCVCDRLAFAFLFCIFSIRLFAMDKPSVRKISIVSLTENLSSGRDDSTSCIIPFSRAGNLILVQAKADSMEGNFILDTGAPFLVLNLTYFRDYPATVISDGEQSGITGSTPSISQTFIKQLTL